MKQSTLDKHNPAFKCDIVASCVNNPTERISRQDEVRFYSTIRNYVKYYKESGKMRTKKSTVRIQKAFLRELFFQLRFLRPSNSTRLDVSRLHAFDKYIDSLNLIDPTPKAAWSHKVESTPKENGKFIGKRFIRIDMEKVPCYEKDSLAFKEKAVQKAYTESKKGVVSTLLPIRIESR